MIKVVLKPSEYAMAAYLSSVRQFANEQCGIQDKQMGANDGLKIAIDGYVAELAVCRHFNVMPDVSFDPRRGGWDCVIQGKKVDIKSTKLNRYDVFIPERKKFNDVDRYIWCWVDFRTVFIIGWFKAEDIFKAENLTQSPRPNEKHYAVDLHNARPLGEN